MDECARVTGSGQTGGAICPRDRNPNDIEER
jgi:hypothetical protein